jgi:hypothetical protein
MKISLNGENVWQVVIWYGVKKLSTSPFQPQKITSQMICVSKLPSIVRTATWEIGSTRLTNHKAQGLFLAEAFSPRQHVLDLGVLPDVLPAGNLPGYQRACLVGEIPLGKDMVREVRQAALTPEMR